MASNGGVVPDWLQHAVQLSQKDEDILEHLTNIESEELEGEEDEDGDEIAGFRLSFHFAKNPFFDHEVLVSPAHGGLLPPRGRALLCREDW